MSVLDSTLRPVIADITELDTRIETLAAELKHLDDQKNSGLDVDVSDYNAKVEAHNQILTRRNALFSANQANLRTYENLSKQDSEWVDQYNALLRISRR